MAMMVMVMVIIMVMVMVKVCFFTVHGINLRSEDGGVHAKA